MKREPKNKPPAIKPITHENVTSQTRTYKLITPLYGGGDEPNKADPISVIRATEVRGHLRFWWRATRGGTNSSIDEMRTKEAIIFGSTENASNISISVNVLNKDQIKREPAFSMKTVHIKGGRQLKMQTSSKIAPYAAFPLLPDKNELKEVDWKSEDIIWNVEFSLTLTYQTVDAEDIEAALWAWETFGGIGARTRRGFGALKVLSTTKNGVAEKSPQTSIHEIQDAIKDGLTKHLANTEKWLPEIPHLNKNLKFSIITGNDNATPIIRWKRIIKQFGAFRQKRYGSSGLSKWHEANEIRCLFGKKPRLAENDTHVSKFPRAVFGLPIIFHMPHDNLEDSTLQGIETSENKKFPRLASPLILRPIACSDGAVSMAAILQWDSLDLADEPYTPPGGLILMKAPGNPQVKSRLEKNESQHISPLDGNPDVLQAFLNSLKN